MKTAFKGAFARDLKSIKTKALRETVAKLIELVEAAPSLADIPNTKKLKTKGNYYRIKLGDYRVGITLENDEITFVRCLDRKEIYRYFP